MGLAAKALLCCDLADTAQSLTRIVASSPALRSIGVARSRVEAMDLMSLGPDLLVVDARLDCDRGLSFCDKIVGLSTPVLLVVEPGDEEEARRSAAQRGRSAVFAVGRDVVQRGDASSDAVVRTRMCLLAANAHHSDTHPPSTSTVGGALMGLVAAPYDAVVVVGSAGTPHLLPRLLPSGRVAGAPLVVAVHHNPRFSPDFIQWLGELTGRTPRPYDPDAVVLARPMDLFAASAAVSPAGPDVLGPDLGGLLVQLAERRLRLLVCVLSGMDDPVAPGLLEVAHVGGRVAILDPAVCAQPAMVQTARRAGVVDAELSVEAMAWLIQSARARATP